MILAENRQVIGAPISRTQRYNCLLKPLVRKTPFVTLLFDSCHSGSILRDDFGTAIRGIDPDGEVRKNHGINSAELSGWLPTPERRGGDSSLGDMHSSHPVGQVNLPWKCQ
jgi:hypothetical protein